MWRIKLVFVAQGESNHNIFTLEHLQRVHHVKCLRMQQTSFSSVVLEAHEDAEGSATSTVVLLPSQLASFPTFIPVREVERCVMMPWALILLIFRVSVQ